MISAQKALQSYSNNLVINGSQCKLALKKREMVKKGRMLYLNQCEELANFYLSFNGWSSQILYHQMEEDNGSNLTFATAIKLSFGTKKQSVEGIHIEAKLVVRGKTILERLGSAQILYQSNFPALFSKPVSHGEKRGKCTKCIKTLKDFEVGNLLKLIQY